MIKKSIVGLVVCLLFVTNVWALTTYVLDTGDPNERVCNPKSYTDLGNGIVRDNVTGLQWQQETAPGTYDWEQALEYVQGLNKSKYLGHRDWRLPTIKELSTLVDSSIPEPGPTIDTTLFPKTAASYYWSSTMSTSYLDDAYQVLFSLGQVSTFYQTSYFHVRAVRGGSYGLSDNLVINGNGTIHDTSTGLMWQQCNHGQTWNGTECAGSAATQTWDQAVAYVQELNTTNYLGYRDWRLPTRNELQSLVDYSRYSPATIFPNTVWSDYWSSTTYASYGLHAWYVNFDIGYVEGYDKTVGSYVRAVRGGICMPQCELIVTHKQISSEKLTKPRKVVLNITSANEAFDVFGRIDLGPLTWEKVQFNRKKNQLKIHAIVPADLKPGSIPISVGGCFGEVVITGTDR